MSTPLSRLVTRVAYGVNQLPRVAWYMSHGLILRQLSNAARQHDGRTSRQRVRAKYPLPDRRRIYVDMAALLLQDLANVEAGVYPLPSDHDGTLFTRLHRSWLLFEDIPEIHRRRSRHSYREVCNEKTRGTRPDYYLQNFHFQSGGWMTQESAERYDTQVEVLFKGTANAIRRQALPQLREAFAGRDQRKLSLVDIGCGTGRFLDFVKQTWPRLPVIGLDMSEAYAKHAEHHLRRWSRRRFIVGKAESIPLPDDSQDVTTAIFLFHELPSAIRRLAVQECARVLKPGGRLVVIDSLQHGDDPNYDGLLDLFPKGYHEPYYESYIHEDFRRLAAENNLTYTRGVRAFVSKVMVFDKPIIGRIATVLAK
jgi:ubiquinone/menaquinone biosynthesis C-methylase UbiE